MILIFITFFKEITPSQSKGLLSRGLKPSISEHRTIFTPFQIFYPQLIMPTHELPCPKSLPFLKKRQKEEILSALVTKNIDAIKKSLNNLKDFRDLDPEIFDYLIMMPDDFNTDRYIIICRLIAEKKEYSPKQINKLLTNYRHLQILHPEDSQAILSFLRQTGSAFPKYKKIITEVIVEILNQDNW